MALEALCRKQKPKATQLWPWRYAKIEDKSLNFYESEDDTKDPRGSSIADVTGCTIGHGREKFWLDTSPGNYHLITLTRKGHANGLPDLLPPFGTGGVAQICFPEDKEADCERFAAALINLAAERAWNVSEADAALAAAARRASYAPRPSVTPISDQSDWWPIPEPQPEPEPDPKPEPAGMASGAPAPAPGAPSAPAPSPSPLDEIPGRSRPKIKEIIGAGAGAPEAVLCEIEAIAEGSAKIEDGLDLSSSVPELKLGTWRAPDDIEKIHQPSAARAAHSHLFQASQVMTVADAVSAQAIPTTAISGDL